MASKSAYMIFVFPVAVSVPAAAFVMAGLMDGGAEASAASVRLVGLPEIHPASEPLVVSALADPAFDCGDVYITVFGPDGARIAQESYLEQCFAAAGAPVPVGGQFALTLAEGTYRVAVDVIDSTNENAASDAAIVTVG